MSLFRAELKGRDLIELDLSQSTPQVKVLGCTEILSLVRRFQMQHGKDPQKWPLPTGISHSELLLKEVLLKSRNQWVYPYQHTELCHCRAVETETVDQAIIAGAHQCEVVSRQTSASTACGTCRLDVQTIIDFRLKSPKCS
jgi:bacterioferritin-associated ferredoxin